MNIINTKNTTHLTTQFLNLIFIVFFMFLISGNVYAGPAKCSTSTIKEGNFVTLVMGDWSCDGHCIREERTLCINNVDFSKAITQGEAKMGWFFTNEIASNYQDRSLTEKQIKALQSHGIKVPDSVIEEMREGSYYLDANSYVAIVVQIAKVGNPTLEFSILNNESVTIGGYGLFDH